MAKYWCSWGVRKDNGFWIAKAPQWKFMFKGHDALYVAAWKFRVRIMKP